MNLTASNLCHAIGRLRRDVAYDYINPKTQTKFLIRDVCIPEGPIQFIRWNPSKGENQQDVQPSTISSSALKRLASAIKEGVPVNVDRVLGASYNNRSVLEAMLANTPEFYYCYPGRIEYDTSSTEIKKGHKHLIWVPSSPHPAGVISRFETDVVISEIPTATAIYEALVLPGVDDQVDNSVSRIDIDVKRRHAQIQVALVVIGQHLKFRTYVARNDQGIIAGNRRLGEFDSVVIDLRTENLLSVSPAAVNNALMIDCIWFKNGTLMPAVIEIEHSTGVLSGLTRMQRFKQSFPPFPTRYVIAAPDEDRARVIEACNRSQFRDLDAKYFPYSAIEELYSLLQRRRIEGVTEQFIDSFMESTLN